MFVIVVAIIEMANALCCKWPTVVGRSRVDHGRACHREYIPITALNDRIVLGNAWLRAFMWQIKLATSIRYLGTIVRVAALDAVAATELTQGICSFITCFGVHGVCPFEPCSKILHRQNVAATVKSDVPRLVGLHHVVTSDDIAPIFCRTLETARPVRHLSDFSAHARNAMWICRLMC